ncbi:MAG: flagellar protein FliT [Deltaproteobacteria bacterium]|nr:flagellar protein FliT [Deltaproteobacteria bacterium]
MKFDPSPLNRKYTLLLSLLDVTERMRELSRSDDYEALSILLNRRQGLLNEVQGIDGRGSAWAEPSQDIESEECRRVIEKINSFDREIRLRIACGMDVISEQLETVKRGKAALKGYGTIFLSSNTLKDVRG